MKSLLYILFIFASNTGFTQSVNVPNSFKTSFTSKGLDKKYILYALVKNPFLEADFNGDSTQDLAVLVVEKATKKKGVMLMHATTNEHFIFGAGTKFGELDDFTWASKWTIYKKRTAYEKFFNKENGDLIGDREIRLARPAILIEDESGKTGGLIYWNGKSYIWVHQGE